MKSEKKEKKQKTSKQKIVWYGMHFCNILERIDFKAFHLIINQNKGQLQI